MRIKRIMLMLLMICFLLIPIQTKADYTGPLLEISEINFPDAAFRTFLIEEALKPRILTEIDGTNYYMIPDQAITLSVSGRNAIMNMKGVELLNVEKLTVTDCDSLQYLDLSGQNNLKELIVNNCASISGINVNNCKQLQKIEISGNLALETFKANACTTLPRLKCENNGLAEINLSGCSSLTDIYCRNNQLKKLVLDGCTNLQYLYCNNNLLSELSLQNYTALKSLQCINNHISTLRISHSPMLISVYCSDNLLQDLVIDDCPALKDLDCANNRLSMINLDGITSLENLYIPSNELEKLDISNCPILCGYVKERQDSRKETNTKVFYKVGATGESYLTYDLNTALIYDEGVIPAGGLVEIQKKENSISVSAKTLYAGKTVNLGARSKTAMTFSSSNKSIVTITSTGVVKGIAPGTATITIKAKETAQYLPTEKKVKITVYADKGKKYTVGNYQYKVTSAAVNGNETVTLMKPTKITFKTVTVPASVKIGVVNYKVTAIGNKAFTQNKMLTKLTIGANIKTIGAYAFYGDTKLKTIVVKSKGIKTVGSMAFKGIYKKPVVRVPASKKKAYKNLFVKAKIPGGVVIKAG